ncbi:hypothetical protein H671_3g9340 [Cricetulus griseus]|nr:hypothetical protein H671_3g9340 [Cricetulus griseus]
MQVCQCCDRRFVLQRMPGQSAKARHLRAATGTPGTRSPRPDLERAPRAAEHLSRIRERGGHRLELWVAGEGDHRVLPLSYKPQDEFRN